MKISLNPLKLLEELINEHGSNAILRERLLLLKDKLQSLVDLNASLSAEKTDLIRQFQEIKLNLDACRNKLKQYEETPPLDPCPYCRKHEGELNRIEPDKTFGDLGLKIGFYKCRSCGKEYEKEQGSI